MSTVTPTINLVPVSNFENEAFRKSIENALAAVPAKHSRAILDIDNKGLGIMYVTRFNDEWALVLGGRWNREDHQGAARVVVEHSWK